MSHLACSAPGGNNPVVLSSSPQAGRRPPSLRALLLLLAGLLEPAAQGGEGLGPPHPLATTAGSGGALWFSGAAMGLGGSRPHPALTRVPFQGNMSRGNSLFFRKVPAGKRYVWEERRFR